jgi:hypothetical protein
MSLFDLDANIVSEILTMARDDPGSGKGTGSAILFRRTFS